MNTMARGGFKRQNTTGMATLVPKTPQTDSKMKMTSKMKKTSKMKTNLKMKTTSKMKTTLKMKTT